MKEIVPTQPAIVHNEQQAVLGLFQKYVVPSYGRFELAFSHYDEAPENIAKPLIAEYEKNRAEGD